MSSDYVDTLDDIEGGLTATIHYDHDTSRPFDDDEAVHIVVLHKRYKDPAEGSLGDTPKDVQGWCDRNAGEWYSVPLWMYDHSGTVYRVAAENPFHCPWDSGRVGIVALKRSDWGEGSESDDKMFEYAQNVASEYSDWANGQCFGYVIKNEDGEELDSCWGFIGRDAVDAEARSSAARLATPQTASTAP